MQNFTRIEIENEAKFLWLLAGKKVILKLKLYNQKIQLSSSYQARNRKNSQNTKNLT